MEEKQLLVFRCGDDEYGIPVEDVCEVIGDAWLNGLPVLGIPENGRNLWSRPISIMKLYAGRKKGNHNRIIVTQSNGIQFAILVDEVLRVIKAPVSGGPTPYPNIANFKIWNLAASGLEVQGGAEQMLERKSQIVV